MAFAPELSLPDSPPRAALNEQVAIVLDSIDEAVISPLKSVPSVVTRRPLDSAASEPAHTNAAANALGDWAFGKARRLRDRSVIASDDDAGATENWDVLVDDVFARLGAR